MKIKFIGFDKDGTLMDSMASYASEWARIVHADYGIEAKEAEELFVKTEGQSTAVQLETLLRQKNITLPQEEIFRKSNEIATFLGERDNSKPFPEVLDILKKLKEKGYFIFVSSGQQEQIVKRDLERTGLIKYIDLAEGIRPDQPNFKKGEPHFRAAAQYFNVPFETFVKETVFIGDTPTDVQVSRESNIISIVRKGVNSDDSLLNEGARFVVDNFSNLPELISTL
jgi:phosphoglycolate phosphatase-like HAD superfamily hydrolase